MAKKTLIIGCGIAGITAAIQAKLQGADVIVCAMSYPLRSQSVMAQGGINVSCGDDIKKHIEDTFWGGKEIGDINAINFMCQQSLDALTFLENCGVCFSRNESRIIARSFGGSRLQRTYFIGDSTGHAIMSSLQDKAIALEIAFHIPLMLIDIITNKGCALGAKFWNPITQQIEKIYADATIIATGGIGQVFQKTTNGYESCGAGIASALRAGAELSNMEFIQYHPTTITKNHILLSESARGEGGYLINSQGIRFVNELETRDKVARAIYTQYQNGNNVYLDLRHLSRELIKEKLKQEYELALHYANCDLTQEIIEVKPAMHYMMGGINVNLNGETNIKNLYACGEVAYTGVHGANRLGGNSLLEAVVWGRSVGNHIAKSKCQKNDNQEDEILPIALLPYENNKLIQKITQEALGIETNNYLLDIGIEKLQPFFQETYEVKEIRDYKEWYAKICYDKLMIAIVCLKSAKLRQESRGSLYKHDYPMQLQEKIVTIVQKNGKKINYLQKPLDN